MHCPVCGTEFEPQRPRQKYCCFRCQRYANRHGANDIRPTPSPDDPIIREFHCLKCGKIVRVTDKHDGRMKFCCQHCEKLYWKHSRKARAQTVYREFTCRTCGTLVEVSEPFDRRRIYCSKTCQQHWNRMVMEEKRKKLRNQTAEEPSKK